MNATKQNFETVKEIIDILHVITQRERHIQFLASLEEELKAPQE